MDLWIFFLSFLTTYLELLSSNGLHVAFLANSEVVGDLCICGVDLGPREGITILGYLCNQLVVTAFLNDVIRDTCGEMRATIQTPKQSSKSEWLEM